MRYMRTLIMMGCCMAMAGTIYADSAGINPVQLRCEYLSNPMAIGVSAPRLCWRLEATEGAGRGAAQSAYQILVASTAEKLTANTGDLWDSGQVTDSESLHRPAAGAALSSRQRAFWKVLPSPWA